MSKVTNLDALTFTVEAGILPAGKFVCTLSKVEIVDGNYETPACRFCFVATEGENKGRSITTLTGARPLEGNRLCRLLESLGAKATAGSKIRVDEIVGKHFEVVVENAEDGGTRFESATPVA